MRKLIALALALSLLWSFAFADSMPEFVERWNKSTGTTGAPQISAADAKEDQEDCWQFRGDGWYFRVCFWKGFLFYAEADAESPSVFLALCVSMGAAAVNGKTSEDFILYEANILSGFLRIEADDNANHPVLGGFRFTLEKYDGRYWLTMEES